MIDPRIPSANGDYALRVRAVTPLQIQAGRLGIADIPSGWVLYFGSARGPGGLRACLARHAKPPSQKRAHWHIDYLTAAASIQEIWWLDDDQRHECRWARLAADIGHCVPAFGASECKCHSHLISLTTQRLVQYVWDRLYHDSNGRLQRTNLVQVINPCPEKSLSRPVRS